MQQYFYCDGNRYEVPSAAAASSAGKKRCPLTLPSDEQTGPATLCVEGPHPSVRHGGWGSCWVAAGGAGTSGFATVLSTLFVFCSVACIGLPCWIGSVGQALRALSGMPGSKSDKGAGTRPTLDARQNMALAEQLRKERRCVSARSAWQRAELLLCRCAPRGGGQARRRGLHFAALAFPWHGLCQLTMVLAARRADLAAG